jgi:hypothetical protein
MARASIDEDQLKEVLKKAIVEVLEERRDLFSDLIAEVIEDLALVRAIREGEATESVSRAEIFQVLEDES